MKTEIFKKVIKQAVKEAIKEEIKDILMEAVLEASKSPKSIVNENIQKSSPTPVPQPTPSTVDLRQKYMDILGETAMSFSTKDISPFNPSGATDIINGDLGSGEVGMDQIMSLLNTK
jgi:hypothetical protein